jgi:ubiquinone/menaquinone biosynthesis C-methylase UbiE
MLQTLPFEQHVKKYDDWYDKYPEVYQSEITAIKSQLLTLPKNIKGIEVGVGTGRFSAPLGIKEGIEPVEEMAEYAVKRGVEIMKGTAEKLPYKDMQFDFVLFVTICHLDKVKAALKEAYRVLKKEGAVILSFLDKDQSIAKTYEAKRDKSNFYKNATFYSVDRVSKMLESTGFYQLDFNQTLFGELDDIKELQSPKAGFGEGSFVTVKAIKK